MLIPQPTNLAAEPLHLHRSLLPGEEISQSWPGLHRGPPSKIVNEDDEKAMDKIYKVHTILAVAAPRGIELDNLRSQYVMRTTKLFQLTRIRKMSS